MEISIAWICAWTGTSVYVMTLKVGMPHIKLHKDWPASFRESFHWCRLHTQLGRYQTERYAAPSNLHRNNNYLGGVFNHLWQTVHFALIIKLTFKCSQLAFKLIFSETYTCISVVIIAHLLHLIDAFNLKGYVLKHFPLKYILGMNYWQDSKIVLGTINQQNIRDTGHWYLF